MNRKGFSLVELLITVALVGILAAIAIPTYLNYIDKAKRTKSIAALKVVGTELAAYNSEKGKYPLSISSMPLFTDQDNNPILHGMNLSQLRTDLYNWDTDAIYLPGPEGTDYTVTAKAKDSGHTLLTLTPKGVTW